MVSFFRRRKPDADAAPTDSGAHARYSVEELAAAFPTAPAASITASADEPVVTEAPAQPAIDPSTVAPPPAEQAIATSRVVEADRPEPAAPGR